jgi:YVTN family beta-propeller protein
MLYEVDPGSNTVSRQFAVGEVAIDVTVSRDGRYAYVTNTASNSVSIVYLQTGAVASTIGGLTNPHSIIIAGNRE